MANAKKTTVTKEIVTGLTLELTCYEAQALTEVLAVTSGDIYDSPRAYLYSVEVALAAEGFEFTPGYLDQCDNQVYLPDGELPRVGPVEES